VKHHPSLVVLVCALASVIHAAPSAGPQPAKSTPPATSSCSTRGGCRVRTLRSARSLDDFARAFFGIDVGSWTPVVYSFEDVVAALSRVEP